MERKLYRSRKNRILAGVAGGLGEYFDIDPVFVRVIFVLATLAGAWGVLAYIILWIVIPNQKFDFELKPQTAEGETTMEERDPIREYNQRRQHQGRIGGAVLIVIGVLFLANNYLPDFDFGNTWPLILVAIGVVLIMNSVRRENKEESHEG